MTQRLNYAQQSPHLFEKFLDFSNAIKQAGIEQPLLDLVDIRASQLNGCAFCLDMHVKQAKIHGERELRIHHLSIWRESPLFSAPERAALVWTEVLTRIPEGGVPDETYEHVRSHFSEKEVVDLTFLGAVINAWNRIAISMRSVPGIYQPRGATHG